jgi:hypothetical protein
MKNRSPDDPTNLDGPVLSIRTTPELDAEIEKFCAHHLKTYCDPLPKTQAARMLMGLGLAKWRESQAAEGSEVAVTPPARR